MLKIMY